MGKDWLKYLVAVSAILIAGSAAFFSVTGLGVLFSGAAIAVMIMAGSLEFAKLVTATYLKQEWDSIKGINKWYLTSAVVILMAITSAGIFGYLSNAFQQQNLKLDQVQREINVWNNKVEYTNQQIATLQGQQKDLTSTQNSLITKGNVNNRLLRSVDNRDRQSSSINKKINSLQDSIIVYNAKINDVKNNNISIEREVGGFRFVAEAFGVELKSVVKFFIILIVIVFDPLAVALVISFNQLVMVKRKDEDDIKPTDPNELKDFVDETARLHLTQDDLKILEEALLNPPPPNDVLKEASKKFKQEIEKLEKEPFGEMLFKEDDIRMDIIGQNGNEGLHYEQETSPKLSEEELLELKEELEEAIIASQQLLKETLKTESKEDIINNTPISREERQFILGEMIKNNQEMGLYDEPFDNPLIKEDDITDWDVTLMDGLKDEEPFYTEDELKKLMEIDQNLKFNEEEYDENLFQQEPTVEEEERNFSTIEPNMRIFYKKNMG